MYKCFEQFFFPFGHKQQLGGGIVAAGRCFVRITYDVAAAEVKQLCGRYAQYRGYFQKAFHTKGMDIVFDVAVAFLRNTQLLRHKLLCVVA